MLDVYGREILNSISRKEKIPINFSKFSGKKTFPGNVAFIFSFGDVFLAFNFFANFALYLVQMRQIVMLKNICINSTSLNKLVIIALILTKQF